MNGEKERILEKYLWMQKIGETAKRNGWIFDISIAEDGYIEVTFTIDIPSAQEATAWFSLEDTSSDQMAPEFLNNMKDAFDETASNLKTLFYGREGLGTEELIQLGAQDFVNDELKKMQDMANVRSEYFAEKAAKLYEKTAALLRETAVMMRGIRELSGLTRDAFGEFYGISTQTLRNWETGKRSCPAYVSALLERAVREDVNQKEQLKYCHSKETLHELGYCLHGLLACSGFLREDSCACACEYPIIHFLDALEDVIGIQLPKGLAKRVRNLISGNNLQKLTAVGEIPVEENKWEYFKEGFNVFKQEASLFKAR